MKKYTQAEFDNFEVDEYGYKTCPSGDYSGIERFPMGCIFGEGCSFGEKCSFGKNCSFVELCSFVDGCSFGENCRFGYDCTFGGRCSFGEGCRFGERCSHEGLTNSVYFACDKIGSKKRKTYFFKADEGYFVRAGCFFGTFEQFIERVKEVHSGTRYEKEYLAAVELAKIVLGCSNGERTDNG